LHKAGARLVTGDLDDPVSLGPRCAASTACSSC
jgi:hypothetical protein